MKVKRRISKLAEMISSNARKIRMKFLHREKSEGKQEQLGKGQKQGLDIHETPLSV